MLTIENETQLRMQLRAAGVTDANRASKFVADLTNLGILPGDLTEFVSELSASAMAENVLLTALRISDVQPEALQMVFSESVLMRAFMRVCGASDMLADYLVRYPQLCQNLNHASWEELQVAAQENTLTAFFATCAQTLGLALNSADGIRAGYWQALLLVAAADLGAFTADSVALEKTSALLSKLVDTVLQLGLQDALEKIGGVNLVDFAVIAMGKTGAQELNYISDVDLIYIFEPCGQISEVQGLQLASQIATHLGLITSGPGSQPPLWPIDLGLRPEGKDGAVARTLESYRTYYQNWAQNWEFQALLKARFAAGDADLGAKFLKLVEPLVWNVSSKPDFVTEARAMRQTVEANIPRKDMERQLKLGRGGLRDIEFSVQLLQLVHGRTDEKLRLRATLPAIEVLSEGGYIGREAGKELAQCYQFLRILEHRSQLLKMRRTHLVPTQSAVLTRLARSMRSHYPQLLSAQDLEAHWQRIKIQVRELHQAIFYRPLVETLVRLGDSLETMSQTQAYARLQAFGYHDPQGTLRHVQVLSKGTTRTAMIQRQILPAVIAWLADGADPDQGMLNFRKLSEEIGSSHWYLGLLRDSNVAAKRLCRILPTSTYATHALMKLPEAVKWLDDDSQLVPLKSAVIAAEAHAILDRYDYSELAVERLRALRDREFTRAAIADLVLGIDQDRCAQMITWATDVCIEAALEVSKRSLGITQTQVLAVAMGRYGGEELTYGSDADVIFVHTGELAEAEAIIKKAVAMLNSGSEYTPVNLDIDLRPEGKNGVLSRTVFGYADYWLKWAAAWEKHALVRARTINLLGFIPWGEEFIEEAAKVRWRSGLKPAELKQIRLLKARMETERIPRGITSSHHLKLGPGGLTDVEWFVQVKQLELASQYPQLQTTNTLRALESLTEMGAVSYKDTQILKTAWLQASHLRAANVLATDRTRNRDVIPRQLSNARMVALILGNSPDEWQQVNEQLLRQARLARKVFAEGFYA